MLRRIVRAMTGEPVDPAAARAAMVARQLRARGIEDERVLSAMATIPREAFLDDRQRNYAYADEALPIESGQTISQPYVVARMTELLAPRPGDRILEIGTGSGYQAAILAAMDAKVTSIERHPDLAAHARARLAEVLPDATVDVWVGDGTLGAVDGAPWDGIIVTAAAPAVPDSLREQLADGARLVIPVGSRMRQELLVVTRQGNDWLEQPDGAVVFVPLIGDEGFDGP
jgi:protein-L-isoaspartate(D-aspartate) O-methyltransferase